MASPRRAVQVWSLRVDGNGENRDTQEREHGSPDVCMGNQRFRVAVATPQEPQSSVENSGRELWTSDAMFPLCSARSVVATGEPGGSGLPSWRRKPVNRKRRA